MCNIFCHFLSIFFSCSGNYYILYLQLRQDFFGGEGWLSLIIIFCLFVHSVFGLLILGLILGFLVLKNGSHDSSEKK